MGTHPSKVQDKSEHKKRQPPKKKKKKANNQQKLGEDHMQKGLMVMK